MRKRKSNKGALIAVIASLSVVSVVSVGFASWLITGADSAEISGEISVETVEDKRYFIYDKSNLAVNYGNDTNGDPASAIQYGIDDSTPINTAWLTAAASGNKYENLTATLTLHVANLAQSATNITATIAPTNSSNGGTKTGWYAAVQHGYVGSMTTSINVTNETSNLEPNDTSLVFRKVIITVTFTWGDTFGGGNPYTFYNTQDYTAELASAAKSNLLGLETDLSGVGFTLTVATTVPNN